MAPWALPCVATKVSSCIEKGEDPLAPSKAAPVAPTATGCVISCRSHLDWLGSQREEVAPSVNERFEFVQLRRRLHQADEDDVITTIELGVQRALEAQTHVFKTRHARRIVAVVGSVKLLDHVRGETSRQR